MFFGGRFNAPQQEVNNREYYDVLGVERGASVEEIKKAYKRMAVKHHPDKGGDVEAFKKVQEAATVLCDPTKRQEYDRFGAAGPQGGGFPFATAVRRERKVAVIVARVEISLEEAYVGSTFRVEVERKIACPGCHGSGCRQGAVSRECATCRGSGVETMKRALGLGIVQQVQTECRTCAGARVVVNPEDVCTGCRGCKVLFERGDVRFQLFAGTRHGQKVVVPGEGHAVPGMAKGDVVVEVLIAPHRVFKRRGDDLLVQMRISLCEALGQRSGLLLDHLDGRTLRFAADRSVIHPGTTVRIPNEGMPKRGAGNGRGDLFVHLQVVFPDELSEDVLAQACALLGPSCEDLVAPLGEDCDEPVDVSFETAALNDFGANDAPDEDEEVQEDGIGCQQM